MNMKQCVSVLLMALAVGACSSARTFREAAQVYVDEFDLSGASCGLGKQARACASVDGHPLTMRGKAFTRGFGTHPESAVAFRANGKVKAFDALVGIDDDAQAANRYGRPAAVVFKVWADGRIVWRSETIRDNAPPVPVHVDLAGAREIVLETTAGVAWFDFHAMNADWADARFTYAEGAEIEMVSDRRRFEQLSILTPPEKAEPQFNGADIWGVRPGHPVIFRVPISGRRPMRLTAEGLPPGVTFDATYGVLRGTAPQTAGDYDIRVTAENDAGRAERTIRLAVGDRIALTPQMGWNSWNIWGWCLTQARAMDSVRALQESGLADHGWAYVNLDDWWAHNNEVLAEGKECRQRGAERARDVGFDDVTGPARDAEGQILSNRSFPDMRAFTDYAHSFGFKAGLYSSPGPLTCGLCEGSLGHEEQDAARYAEWGFDYLKYDWCSYNKVFAKETGLGGWGDRRAWHDMKYREAFVKPYRKMGEALRRQNRDIFYSLCQYGMGGVEDWARTVGANSWRSWDDLKDMWGWMELAVESEIGGEFWRYSGPGCWADPDMLIIGNQKSCGATHPTFLTPNEQYTHVSLWSMVGAPLLIGCDLTRLDAFTRSLLVNDEVIAISQDRLGKVARRVRHDDVSSIWTRPLANGDRAVAIVNRYPMSREIAFDFAEVGASEHCWVRDCWRQECEGRHHRRYVVTVPPHATKLVRLREIACPRCE